MLQHRIRCPQVSCPRGRSRVNSRPWSCAVYAPERTPVTTRIYEQTQPSLSSVDIDETACIYLDYNATSPVHPQVAAVMFPFITQHFGNPSSVHVYGKVCRSAVNKARQQVARLVGAEPDEILFTASGTESNHSAIYGAIMAARERNPGMVPHVVTSSIEHTAVGAFLEHLQKEGLCRFSCVPVSVEGVVDPADVAAAITPDTVLVSVMHSNNEVGSLQPIREIASIAHSHPGVLVHCDAAQSVGKVPVSVKDLGVDLLSLVGHKFGAPKGVAALYIRDGVSLVPLMHGGSQEGGRRAGTENVPHIVALGQAAELALMHGPSMSQHMANMCQRLRDKITQAFQEDQVLINGPSDPAQRLPNTLSVSLKGCAAPMLLQKLARRLALSSGSACHSHTGPTISHVMKAMKVPAEFAYGTVRLSTGPSTTAEEVDGAVQALAEAAATMGVKVRAPPTPATAGAADTTNGLRSHPLAQPTNGYAPGADVIMASHDPSPPATPLPANAYAAAGHGPAPNNGNGNGNGSLRMSNGNGNGSISNGSMSNGRSNGNHRHE